MFSEGDKVTIKRGKGAGREATIMGPADKDNEYPVRFTDGGYAIVKATNLKAPAESTIGEGRLAAEINTLVGDSHQEDAGAIQSFVSRLSAEMPGLAARISWPAESAEA